MRCALGCLVLVCVGLPWSSQGAETSKADELALVENGRARAVIVIPDDPLPVHEYAAEELAWHLKRISGAEIPVGGEADARPAEGFVEIHIGPTRAAAEAGVDMEELPEFGFALKRVGDALYFYGVDGSAPMPEQRALPGTGPGRSPDIRTPVGSLMAVYEFLERELGVRWVWPGDLGVVAPASPTIRVGGDGFVSEPRFAHINMRAGRAHNRSGAGWRDRRAAERFYFDEDVWMLRQRVVSNRNFNFGHAFKDWWKEYGETHPEFFARLPDGTRRPLDGDPEGIYITMCVSNPDLHREIVRRWLEAGKPRILNVCENDTPGMCTCEGCRAWDYPDPAFELADYWGGGEIPDRGRRFGALRSIDGGGAEPGALSLSDRYARFYLAVQEEAAKHLEEGEEPPFVFGYAYANYAHPPRDVQLNENIIISFVAWPYFPLTPENVEGSIALWDGWRELGPRLALRPNTTLSGHNMPIHYAENLARLIQHSAANGMISGDFDSFLGQWGAQGPTLYTLARTLVRPEMPVEEVLDEYYSAFGPAKDAVKRYFEHWNRVSSAITGQQYQQFRQETQGGDVKNWVLVADRIFTPAVMREGRRLLNEARARAAGDPIARQRVEFLDIGFEHAEQTLKALAAFRKWQENPTPANEKAFQQAENTLQKYRGNIEQAGTANMRPLFNRERWRDPNWQR